MRSDAQKRADKAYRDRHQYISLCTNYRTVCLIKAEAARQGQSMNAYILQATKEKMERDKQARKEAQEG